MRRRGVGSIYIAEYLKILERVVAAMQRFPLLEMSPDERKAVVLSYVELVERFQRQLTDAGITRLLDLYGEGQDADETEPDEGIPDPG